jgi:hypothetical protein
MCRPENAESEEEHGKNDERNSKNARNLEEILRTAKGGRDATALLRSSEAQESRTTLRFTGAEKTNA